MFRSDFYFLLCLVDHFKCGAAVAAVNVYRGKNDMRYILALVELVVYTGVTLFYISYTAIH